MSDHRRVLVLVSSVAAGASAIVAAVPSNAQRVEGQAADWRERASAEEIDCNEQEPLSFLIRAHWQTRGVRERAAIRERRAVHRRAITFRTRNYGFFAPFGSASMNASTPGDNVERVRLFDRPVRLNRRIIPAARCAEREIARSCPDDYAPRRLSGIRDRNTYHNNEVSNHVYGIAIDLDPRQNTCCNCVKEWRLHPLCQGTPQSIFERMVMPECWVRGFEKYGFYWLGHDRLMDTMHFEFLGDPAHILRADGPPPHMQ